MGRRPGRTAAKRATAAFGNTPRKAETSDDDDDDDVPMQDVPEISDAELQHDEVAEDEDTADGADANEDDDGATAEAEGVDPGEQDADEQQPPREVTPPPTIIRKKRVGRPPKNRPPGWEQPGTPGTPAAGSEDPTLTPRRRGRGGWRGRGGRKGGQATPTKLEQAIDKEGTRVEVADDECILPEDPEGETKVDPHGNLLGGREYRCRTFTVRGRGERLYMLSTEPARCVGFRDSYLFFTKHLRLYKVVVGDDAKRDMIERQIIPHSYKGRAIGIVTARSVFREFGAKMVVGGRRIIDDYDVAGARAEGAVEGELADPADVYVEGEPYNKNQYVAWHGASSVYHQSVPVAPVTASKPESKKRRVNVNDVNWMLEHAREASNFNSTLTAFRRCNLEGTYEIHTNIIHYPVHMQPTRAVFEHVPPGANQAADGSALLPLSPRIARNYLVVDTHLRAPPRSIAHTALEPEDPDSILASFRGLAAVSDDIKDLLPPDCRRAFDEALQEELEWKKDWEEEKAGTQKQRRPLVIDRSVMPTNVPLRD